MNKLRSLLLASVSFICIVASGQTTIAERQCWFDGQITSAQSLTASLDISDLTTGLHSLSVRVKDSEGMWSSPKTKYFVVAPTATAATSITAREYWIDGDIASRQALTADAAEIDLSALAIGLHSLTVRVCDDNGVWSSPKTKYFVIASTATAATAITAREYWIDGDITSRQVLTADAAEIDLSALAIGLHSLAVRVCDDNGVWSSPKTKYFVIASTATAATAITAREYWLDGDIANRQALTADAAEIDLSALAVGLHSLTVRVCDDNGVWSSPLTKYFVIAPTAKAATAITAREYWLDGDIANRQALTADAAEIDLSALAVGLHSLTVHVCDDNGVWSSPLTKYFVVASTTAAATAITAREYWIDDIANRQTLDESIASIDISELTPGLHFLTIRVKDDNEVWSTPMTQHFVVPRVEEEVTLAHYAYWFDDDNANTQSGRLEADNGIIPVSIKHLDEGRHALKWAVGDSRGKWSEVRADSFDVEHIVITDAMINLTTNTFEYEAADIEPEPTVMDGDETLVRDEDYEVEYANNHDAGTATMTVRGKGFYKETVESEFTITKAPLTVSTTDQVREKGEENPEFALTYEGWKGTDDEASLEQLPVAATTATIESPVGAYDITIAGGESRNYDFIYQGATLTINLLLSQPMMLLGADSYVYEAQDIAPQLTIMDGDTPLVEGTDYEVTCADNRDAGLASFTVTGLGFYHGTLNGTFTIEKATLTVKADDQVKEQGQENPELTLTYEGWKGTDDESVLTALPVATTDATADSPVGTYEIRIDGGEAVNYTFQYVPGVLTIQVPVGIADVRTDGNADEWYTIGGQKLGSRPTKAGIYIHNGQRKVVK